MPAASLPIQRAILAAYIQGAAFHPLRPGGVPEGVQKYMRSKATSISSTAAPIRSTSQK